MADLQLFGSIVYSGEVLDNNTFEIKTVGVKIR